MFSIMEYPHHRAVCAHRSRPTSVFEGLFDDDFFGPSTMSVLTHNTKPSATLNMQLDVKESDNAIELTADLPGVAKKDVTIEIKKGILTVSAERKSERTKRSIDGNKGEDKEEENAQSAVKWTQIEEHTSELQSHSDLVCRLLLEKKKINKNKKKNKHNKKKKKTHI